jgi:membrane protein DedA with SNARE-associated domain
MLPPARPPGFGCDNKTVRELTHLVLRHGYALLFAMVLIEQCGLPIPAVPILLVMGALASLHKFSFLAAWGLATLAATAGDALWYTLGWTRGASILNLLCRISLEPDSCISGAKTTFSRWGAATLLFAKFVPGLGAVATTMAGWIRLPRLRALLVIASGSLLWSLAYLGAGAVFRSQLEEAAAALRRYGGWILALLLGLLAAWLAWKYDQRRRFLRELRVARIKPEELARRIHAGNPPTIVDLRHAIDLEQDPARIPGSIWIDSAGIDQEIAKIPPDREVVLYCS